ARSRSSTSMLRRSRVIDRTRTRGATPAQAPPNREKRSPGDVPRIFAPPAAGRRLGLPGSTMDIALSATIGLLFLLTGAAALFLMMHLWRYPVDPRTRIRAAPIVLVRLHRAIGWVYVLLYLVMMVEMVPRLWLYQIELPARSVAHVALGIGVGVVLLVKLAILR